MGYRYPETLVEEFLTLGQDKQTKILDVACGPGNVAFIVSFKNFQKISLMYLKFIITNITFYQTLWPIYFNTKVIFHDPLLLQLVKDYRPWLLLLNLFQYHNSNNQEL